MADANSPASQMNTIQRHELAVYPAFAMLAGMQLDVFTALKDEALTTEQLAVALGVNVTKLTPLLYALVVTELLTVENDRFGNTAVTNQFLVRGAPAYMDSRQDNFAAFWSALLQTGTSIRTGVPQAKMDYAVMSVEELTTFYRSLHVTALAAGRDLMAHYDFSQHQSLADVGGGSGGVAMAIVEANPQMNATVIDLPSVVPVTQRFLEEADVTDRVQAKVTNIVAEPLTGAFAVAVLRNLIQVLSPADARRALSHIYQGIVPGGELYVYGNVLDNSRLTPEVIVLRSLIFVNSFDDGQAYTEQEYRDWLTEAGFVDTERVILPSAFSIIRARKPA